MTVKTRTGVEDYTNFLHSLPKEAKEQAKIHANVMKGE